MGAQLISSVDGWPMTAVTPERQSCHEDHMARKAYNVYLHLALYETSWLTPSLHISIHSGPGPMPSPKLHQTPPVRTGDKEERQGVTVSATWLLSFTSCRPLTCNSSSRHGAYWPFPQDIGLHCQFRKCQGQLDHQAFAENKVKACSLGWWQWAWHTGWTQVPS